MSDSVTRLNSALEGRYAIERELGEGGMATVYLADDLKHERKVALAAGACERLNVPAVSRAAQLGGPHAYPQRGGRPRGHPPLSV